MGKRRTNQEWQMLIEQSESSSLRDDDEKIVSAP